MILQMENLVFGYGKCDLISGISGCLQPGAVHFLCGPNGSGKSTLLKLLCGYLHPRCGMVKLNEQPIKAMTHIARARNLGVVWQNITAELDFNVREMVVTLAGARFSRLGKLSCRDNLLIDTALEKFALTHLAFHAFNTLSGGERQRTALAGAWALSPEVLLLDEPTSALDPFWRNRVMNLLEEYAVTHTVLMITHDLELLGRARGQVWLLDGNGNFFSGSNSAMLTAENLSRVYQSKAQVTVTGNQRRIYFD